MSKYNIVKENEITNEIFFRNRRKIIASSVSLPFLCCASTLEAPPPASALAFRERKSDSFSSSDAMLSCHTGNTRLILIWYNSGKNTVIVN